MEVRYDHMVVHYEIEGSGPPVTLIHGVGSNLDAWRAITPYLVDEFSVVRYDLRGHGMSSKPAGPYDLSDFVFDLKSLLDALHIRSTCLVGSSLGGIIAQAFTLRHPEMVDKLALISAVAGRTEEQRAAVRSRADALERGGAMLTVDAAIERWFTPTFREAHPDVVEQEVSRVLSNDPAAYAAAYRMFAEADLVDELDRITCPTLIVTGEGDVGSTPEMAQTMHRTIKTSELHVLPNLKHGLLVEGPEVVGPLLRRFLSTNLV